MTFDAKIQQTEHMYLCYQKCIALVTGLQDMPVHLQKFTKPGSSCTNIGIKITLDHCHQETYEQIYILLTWTLEGIDL